MWVITCILIFRCVGGLMVMGRGCEKFVDCASRLQTRDWWARNLVRNLLPCWCVAAIIAAHRIRRSASAVFFIIYTVQLFRKCCCYAHERRCKNWCTTPVHDVIQPQHCAGCARCEWWIGRYHTTHIIKRNYVLCACGVQWRVTDAIFCKVLPLYLCGT